MDTLVVAGNGDVNKLGGAVNVAEGNNRDVDIGGLLDSLVVDARVSHHYEQRLLEGRLVGVSKCSGGEAARDSRSASVSRKLL